MRDRWRVDDHDGVVGAQLADDLGEVLTTEQLGRVRGERTGAQHPADAEKIQDRGIEAPGIGKRADRVVADREPGFDEIDDRLVAAVDERLVALRVGDGEEGAEVRRQRDRMPGDRGVIDGRRLEPHDPREPGSVGCGGRLEITPLLDEPARQFRRLSQS